MKKSQIGTNNDRRRNPSTLDTQRAFFNSGATLSADFRIKSLRRLYDAVKVHEDDIHAALTADLE